MSQCTKDVDNSVALENQKGDFYCQKIIVKRKGGHYSGGRTTLQRKDNICTRGGVTVER